MIDFALGFVGGGLASAWALAIAVVIRQGSVDKAGK